MPRNIKFKGTILTLVGRSLKENNFAADFKVVTQDLKEVALVDFKDKIKIITTFPSLDTPVCDLQVKEFNKQASNLSPEIKILGISKDLPFAQKRFCASFDIKNISILSDYRTSSFGINYGLLIKELNLLARSVVIIDKADMVRYVQIAEELTASLNYAQALDKLQEVIKTPVLSGQKESVLHCQACEGGIPALSKDKIEQLIAQYRGWELVEDKKLVKEFKFKDFTEAKYFLDLVSVMAEEQAHHPTMTIIYNKLKITLTTHAAGGLTENDFVMAKIIDGLEE